MSKVTKETMKNKDIGRTKNEEVKSDEKTSLKVITKETSEATKNDDFKIGKTTTMDIIFPWFSMSSHFLSV